MSDALQAAIDELYGAPLAAFVAERKRLAGDLRAAGDREGAALVAKLPKPTAAAWALNLVAREAPDAVRAWLDSALALRDATTRAREVGGDAIRAASATHRAAAARVGSLVAELARPNGRPPSEPVLDGVRAIMQAAAGDPDLAARVRAGRLVTERATGAADIAALLPPASPGRPAAAPAAERSRAERAAAEAQERLAALEREVAAAQEAASSRRAEVARRAGVAARAEERLEEARRTLHRTQSEAEAARDAVADAEHTAAGAERELERLRAQLRRSQGTSRSAG